MKYLLKTIGLILFILSINLFNSCKKAEENTVNLTNGWLKNFAYKTALSWWIFIFTGIIALIIALLTVSWQSWKAATNNPVESLRFE